MKFQLEVYQDMLRYTQQTFSHIRVTVLTRTMRDELTLSRV